VDLLIYCFWVICSPEQEQGANIMWEK